MYCPAHFAENDGTALRELIRAQPLATLVTLGSDGLQVDHVPLLLSSRDDGTPVLRGHVARANPMWKKLSPGEPAVAVFHGPDAYISPSWYPTKRQHGQAVPTWNYTTVHARGPLRVIEEADWLRAQVEALTAQQEAGLVEPWQVGDAPADYIEKMLAAIVGIEIEIATLEGKRKASQNQPAENRAGIVRALEAAGGDHRREMARLVANDDGR